MTHYKTAPFAILFAWVALSAAHTGHADQTAVLLESFKEVKADTRTDKALLDQVVKDPAHVRARNTLIALDQLYTQKDWKALDQLYREAQENGVTSDTFDESMDSFRDARNRSFKNHLRAMDILQQAEALDGPLTDPSKSAPWESSDFDSFSTGEDSSQDEFRQRSSKLLSQLKSRQEKANRDFASKYPDPAVQLDLASLPVATIREICIRSLENACEWQERIDRTARGKALFEGLPDIIEEGLASISEAVPENQHPFF